MRALRSRAAVGAALVAVVIVAAAVFVLTRGDSDEEQVDVARADTVEMSSLNRADDLGADTVRGYLWAAMQCTPEGAAAMADLSGPENAPVDQRLRAGCQGDRWPDEVEAEVTQPDLDGRHRARWEIEAGSVVPDDFVVYVRQRKGEWRIDGQCVSRCDIEGDKVE